MNKVARILSSLTAEEQVKAKKKIRIALAQQNFYLFCKALAPDFYTPGKPHLKVICDTLQALYEGRVWKKGLYEYDEFGNALLVPDEQQEWQIAKSKADIPEDGFVCKKLRMHMPPRHGKSRTLIYFECWCFGQNINERIITVSYNQGTSEEFSKFVRDEIMKTPTGKPDEIIMKDVFPNVQVKDNDASVSKWSLKGSHFSYMGTSIDGSVTSKGGTIQVVDDPVKDAAKAMNELALEADWKWYTDSFGSRTDAEGGESICILNMTRWASKDLAGMIDNNPSERRLWYVLTMKVMNEETGEMLCEEILSRSKFYSLRNTTSHNILRANYFQEPLDIQGRLYSKFQEYETLPSNISAIKAQCDPADSGKDFLCMIVYAETTTHEAYVLDIVYNNAKVEVTLPLMCKSIMKYGVNKLVMESNGGGRLLSINLKQKLARDFSWFKTIVQAVPTTSKQNKAGRINAMAEQVQDRIHFPVNWENKFDKFATDVYKYISGGKNAHDDGPDTLTRVAEDLVGTSGMTYNGPVNKRDFRSFNASQDATTPFNKPQRRVANIIRRRYGY